MKVEVEQETTYSADQQLGFFAVLLVVNIYFELYLFTTFWAVLGLEPEMYLWLWKEEKKKKKSFDLSFLQRKTT